MLKCLPSYAVPRRVLMRFLWWVRRFLRRLFQRYAAKKVRRCRARGRWCMRWRRRPEMRRERPCLLPQRLFWCRTQGRKPRGLSLEPKKWSSSCPLPLMFHLSVLNSAGHTASNAPELFLGRIGTLDDAMRVNLVAPS